MSQHNAPAKPKRKRTRHPKGNKGGAPVFLYTSFGKNQHKPPEITTERNKDWILYGKKNDYPQYLLKLFNMSGRHNAIITGKVDRILGKGWNFDTDGLLAEQIAGLRACMNKANRGERLIDVTRKIALDMEVFNGFAIEVIYDMKGDIAELFHVDFSKIRKGKDGTEFEHQFIYSDNWESSKPLDAEHNPELIPPYNPRKPEGKQLIYWQGYRPSAEVYPFPQYIGSTAAIETDIEISNWHLNNIKHGFSGGYIINFNNGIPSEEEQRAIERKIIDKHTGSDAAGRFVLNFSDGKDRSAEVIPITPNNLDKQFQQLTQDAAQEIFTGHKVTSPMMFGVKTQGQLGGRTELIDAEELFENTYVKQRRMILEEVINRLLIDKGLVGELFLQPAQTLSFQFSEMTIASVMKTDELRLAAEGMGIELIEPNMEEGEDAVDTGQNAVAEALGVLSPLIATKVLETMTETEIRALVGLSSAGAITEIGMKKLEKFVSEQEDEMLLEMMKDMGEPAENFRTLRTVPLTQAFRNEKQMHLSEIQLLKSYFAPALTISITTLDRKILDLIQSDPLVTIDQISQSVGVGQNEVANIIDRLEKGGAISTLRDEDVEGGVQIRREVTPDAISDIGQLPEVVSEVSIKYRYVERAGVPPAASGSRPFCRQLIARNVLFSREEIETLSASTGRNVWQRRGGFYHNPDTGITTPYCRHIWQQELVTTINPDIDL